MGFEAFWDAAPKMMRQRSAGKVSTRREWWKAVKQLGEAKASADGTSEQRLLGALRTYIAKDPDFPRTGGPSLTRWLRDQKWSHWLPAPSQPLLEVIHVQPPPADLVALLAHNLQHDWNATLLGCRWEGRTVVCRTGWQERELRAWLPPSAWREGITVTVERRA